MIDGKIKLVKGDITKLAVDVIVNAANPSLCGGGGVDGAIHLAAGPQLLEECKGLNGCAVGQAKITKAYQLPAQYVIHTVGPIWRGGVKCEHKLLASCYISCLKLAKAYHMNSIAFPAISCGIYGYPVNLAATIAVKETTQFLELHSMPSLVIFVCFDDAVYESYEQALYLLHSAGAL
jgi:O-acetyl-ADP-ribose deacetylase (regulator of RNase III)